MAPAVDELPAEDGAAPAALGTAGRGETVAVAVAARLEAEGEEPPAAVAKTPGELVGGAAGEPEEVV